jgi:alpha-galactosidase
MKQRLMLIAAVAVAMLSCTNAESSHWIFAPTPPMGWNSWDCFGTTLTEEQVKAQVNAMATYLKPYGWTYFTVDIQCYEPNSQGHPYRRGAHLDMANQTSYCFTVARCVYYSDITNGE